MLTGDGGGITSQPPGGGLYHLPLRGGEELILDGVLNLHNNNHQKSVFASSKAYFFIGINLHLDS